MHSNADFAHGLPDHALPNEATLAGGTALDPAVLEQVATYVRQHDPAAEVAALDGAQAVQSPATENEWLDRRTVRGVLRTAFLNRVERFGERELRQRSAQEIAFILLAFAVAALIAGPALVPIVVALRGGQL